MVEEWTLLVTWQEEHLICKKRGLMTDEVLAWLSCLLQGANGSADATAIPSSLA